MYQRAEEGESALMTVGRYCESPAAACSGTFSTSAAVSSLNCPPLNASVASRMASAMPEAVRSPSRATRLRSRSSPYRSG